MRLEECGNNAVLLGSREESRNNVATCLGAVCCEGERERHGRARQRAVGGSPEPGGERLTQTVRRQSLAREHHNVVGGDTIDLDAVGYELDERRGLARSGRANNNERFTGRALNNSQLSGIEFVAHVCFAWRNESSECGHGVNAIGTVRQCLGG